MIQNDRRIALGCWLLAGLPILATFIQAALALLGLDAINIPVLGGLKGWLDTIEVFDIAGEVFRQNDIVVFVLFILVALSWLGVGGGMFQFHHRQGTYAAAGLVTIFLALFFLVYIPVLTADVSAVQLAGFVAIPVVTVGATWISVSSYEWTATLDAETTELLRETEEKAEQMRHEFDQRIEQVVGSLTIDLLSDTVPNAVAEFEEQSERFREQCEEIQTEVAAIRDGSASPRSRHHQAVELQKRAHDLTPTARANELADQFREHLRQEIRTEFSEFSLTSKYGQRYEIRNMGAYNELSLGDGGPPIQIGGDAHELDERLIGLLDNGVPLQDVAQSVDRIQGHLEELTTEIQDEESTFKNRTNEIETNLSEASSALSRIDSAVADRLEEMLFEKRFGDETPPFPTEVDVRDQLNEAKTALHECRFDRAQRTLKDAAEDAQQIKQIAVFFADSVIPTIEHGDGSIPIPSEVGPEITEQIGIEIRQAYDVMYTVSDGTLSIQSTSEPTTEETEEHTTQSSRSGLTRSEDVRYLLRELQNQASNESARQTVTIQLGEYPERFGDEAVVEELKRFCTRQSAIVEVEVPDTEPGYISITVDDNESVRRVLSTVYTQYRQQN